MSFKQRGYNKDKPQGRVRDYKLFAIACEGIKREAEYFCHFDGIDRIKVDIIRDEEGHYNSSPAGVLSKVKKYIEEVGLSDEDSLWIVVDVDKWPREQLDELHEYCKQYNNWNISISNPCFEVWLLFHKRENLEDTDCSTPEVAKQSLHGLQVGGYCSLDYLPLMPNAIEYAKGNDTNSDHYYPNAKETKVYLLAEALLERIGLPRFEKFKLELLKLKPRKPRIKKKY